MSNADPSSQQTMICRTQHFAGQVQGVGFRYTAYHVAKKFDVVGYVKNLPDGRVELVAEGTANEVDRFVNAVNDAMNGFIEHASFTDCSAQGHFTSFTIGF